MQRFYKLLLPQEQAHTQVPPLSLASHHLCTLTTAPHALGCSVQSTHNPKGRHTTSQKRYPAENEQHIITLCICSAGLEYQIWTMCLTAWHACVPELYTDCSILDVLERIMLAG